MSTLKKLMDLPTEKKIKEGIVSCSWVNAAEIYDMYLSSKSLTGASKAEIFLQIGEKTKQSESTVRHYIYKIEAVLK